jgi:hypothetical protein
MPRQFRSDDTDKWLYGFGNGSDGDLTIGSNTTEVPIDSACTGTASATSLSATNASFAAGQIILIHQTRGTGAGNWELNKIASYVAGTITLERPLMNTYASGAQVRVLKQYRNVTINSGVTYKAKTWTGTVGGILGFFAKGIVNINGTINVAGESGTNQLGDQTGQGTTGAGFRGGKNSNDNSGAGHGEGYTGTYGNESTEGSPGSWSGSDSGNGGTGAGGAQQGGNSGSGGGNGTSGGNGSGSAGGGGSAVGNAALTSMFFGGGGGGGRASGSGAGGGQGGGICAIFGKRIVIDASTGFIDGRGGNGATNPQGGGSSAGGAGASILLKCVSGVLNTTRISAAGGTPGRDSNSGGVGRIHIDYAISFTGTTTPTIDSQLDRSLLSSRPGLGLMMGMLTA